MTTNKQWNKEAVVEFLKRTGDEIRQETQRLIREVNNPENQQKVKEGLKELSAWARSTAEEAAALIDNAVKKAETAFAKAVERGGAPRTDSSWQSSPPPPPPPSKAPKAPAKKVKSKGPTHKKKKA